MPVQRWGITVWGAQERPETPHGFLWQPSPEAPLLTRGHTFLHPVSFVISRVLLWVDDDPCQAKRRRARSSKSHYKGEYHKFSRIESNRRSNHSIFLPRNYGSPFNDTAAHISGLGLARLDFERCAVAGKAIYSRPCFFAERARSLWKKQR